MPRLAALLSFASLAIPTVLTAQGRHNEVFVGSESEEYLRYLQLDGSVRRHPWSLRPFSSRELGQLIPPDSGHPWAVAQRPAPSAPRPAHSALCSFELIRPSLTTYFNSTFPWGYNDGAVWQGKGLTAAVELGASARCGPLSLTVAPTAFTAQNAGFELQDNGLADSLRFAHGWFPFSIDAPQRFGGGAYSRLDPGQSTLRLDLPILTVGFSTASQHWGPAAFNPILLGNNAPGFPHVFLGTSAPVDLGFLRLHGRAVWGQPTQSGFMPRPPTIRRRLLSGLAVVLMPRGLDGLELGAGRLFHERWPEDGLRWQHVVKPFEPILKSSLPDDPNDPENPGNNPDNGLASVFFRWVHPESGLELYGEYGRDDHNWDLRDALLEPDHMGGYVLGLRKLFGRSDSGSWGVRVETMNLQVSQLIQGRSQSPFYNHSRQHEGHTHRGQILGGAFGVGGSATVLRLDRYHAAGRWTVGYTRALLQDGTAAEATPTWDVIHALGGEAVMFVGRFEVSGGLTAMYELNRYLAGDAVNLNAFVGVRAGITGPPPRKGRSPADLQRDRLERNGDTTAVSRLHADDARVAELVGLGKGRHSLIRSPSSETEALSGAEHRLKIAPVRTRLALTWNSALPLSLNDGALWAGRGANTSLAGGFRAEWGPLALTVAPEIVWSENRAFEMPEPEFFPQPIPPGRDSLSSPWHIRPNSIDLPLRFGTTAFATVYPGKSTLRVEGGPVVVGVSTENQWWGPGIRNAIVLSDNAPGFWHLFFRTARPVATPVGELDGKWLVGGLEESKYFDDSPQNDLRSLSALAFVWRPRWIPDLSLGFARAVYQPVRGWAHIAPRFLDAAFSSPGRPNDRAPSDSSQTPGPDQIFSLFGRWVFPRSGFEVYAEWSRTEFPRSFRDLLEAPGHTQGYTIGLQWAKALGGEQDPRAVGGNREKSAIRNPQSAIVRLQAEHTYLEKSTTFRYRPVGTYYTSRAVVQGYTHRGQVLGAAIGPGASSHWLALDYVRPKWRVGVFGSRIRWEDDALYTVYREYTWHWCMHDVSLYGGVRGGYDGPLGSVSLSLARGKRFNAHFQNFSVCGRDFDPSRAVDIANTTFELQYSLPF